MNFSRFETEFLCRAANYFITADDPEEVLRCTGDFLHQMQPDSLVFTGKIDIQRNEITLQSCHASPEIKNSVESEFLKSSVRFKIRSQELFFGQSHSSFTVYDEQFVQNLIPEREESIRLFKWLSDSGFSKVLGIILPDKDFPAGFILLFVKDSGTISDEALMASLINMAGSSLKRLFNEHRMKMYQSMFHYMTDGVIVRASDGLFMDANPAALEILGISKEEIVNTTHPPLILYDHSGQPLPDGKCPSDIALQTGETVLGESVGIFNKKRNQIVWCLFSAIPVLEKFHEKPDKVFILLTDITENRIREENLKQSEQKFRSLISQMHQALFVFDQEGKFITVNPAATRMTGYSEEELLQMKVTDIDFLVSHEDNTINNNSENFLSPNNGTFITTQKRKDGSTYLAEVTLSGIQFEGQSCTLALVRDVTEQKRLEEKLKISEANARKLIQTIPDLFFRLNRQGYFLDYKKVHEDLLLKDTDFTGKHISEVLPEEISVLTLNKIEQALSTSTMQQYEYQLIIPGKPLQYFEARMFPLHLDEVIAIVRNVTERKKHEFQILESEATLRSIMDSLEFGIVLADSEATILNHNQYCTHILRTEQQDLTGQNLCDFFSAEISGSIREGIEKSISSGTTVMFETNVNNLIWEWIINPVKNPDGKIERVSLLFRDITRRKQDEERLRRSEQELRELNAAKDKFFSIIAHDLKSPFNAIIGISNLLKDQVKEKDLGGIEEMSEILSKASEQAYELLSNLLDWSRSQTGRLNPEPSYFELTSAIRKVVEQLKPIADQKSIQIKTTLPHFAPVFADKGMIHTVVRNLMSNAIKFTHPGGTVEIELVSTPTEFIVSVKDTGIGIEPENLQKLFRIDSGFILKGTHNERGTGLGLILCKEFVEKHRGKIFAESQVGKGSTFSFTIPKTLEPYK